MSIAYYQKSCVCSNTTHRPAKSRDDNCSLCGIFRGGRYFFAKFPLKTVCKSPYGEGGILNDCRTETTDSQNAHRLLWLYADFCSHRTVRQFRQVLLLSARIEHRGTESKRRFLPTLREAHHTALPHTSQEVLLRRLQKRVVEPAPLRSCRQFCHHTVFVPGLRKAVQGLRQCP